MSDGIEVATEYPVAQAPVAAPAAATAYDKVGGWLLFLCVSLTILNPLTLVGFGAYNFISLAPAFNRFPTLAIVTVLDALLTVSLAALSAYAGISLWRRRSGSVKLATIFLFAGAAFTILTPLLPLAAGLGSEFNKVVLDSALQSWRGILYYVVWLNYLRQSKRVKATRGLQPLPA